jgi:alanine racemase
VIKGLKTAYLTLPLPPPIKGGEKLTTDISVTGDRSVTNEKAKVVGRVCMDAFMVDVTGIPDVKLGDEVVVMGRQGDDEITAHDLGKWTDTFAHEIMTRMGKRLPIVYRQTPKAY